MPERATRKRSEQSAAVVVVGNGEGPNEEESETTVSLRRKLPQMSRQLELPLESRGEAPNVRRSEEARLAAHGNERSGASGLMELVCERQNLQSALKRVRKNKGSPGIDGMTVDALLDYLKAKWPELREQLLSGKYQPAAVKQQLIPKSGGGSSRAKHQAPGGRQSPGNDERASPSHYEADRRAKHSTSCQRVAELSAGLEGILPASGYAQRVWRIGRMDSTSAPSYPPQAMETRHDHLSRTSGPGGDSRS